MASVRIRDTSILAPTAPVYKHTQLTYRCFAGVVNAELNARMGFAIAIARSAVSGHPAVDPSAQGGIITELLDAARKAYPFNVGVEDEVSDVVTDDGKQLSKKDAALYRRFEELKKRGVIK